MNEVEIRPEFKGWQSVASADVAYRLKCSYSGGHGSGGTVYLDIPRLERIEGEAEYKTARRYFEEALRVIAEFAKGRETELQGKDESDRLLPWVTLYKRTYGEMTIR